MKRRFTYVLSMLLLIMLFPTAVRAEGTKTVYLNFGAGHEATAQHYADTLMKNSEYVLSTSLSGTVMTLTLDADAAQDKTVQNVQYDLYRQIGGGDFKEDDGKQLYVFVQNSNTDMYMDNGPGTEMSQETPLPDTLTLYGFYRLPILTNAITVKAPKYGTEIKEGDVPSITLEGDTANAYLVTSSRWAKRRYDPLFYFHRYSKHFAYHRKYSAHDEVRLLQWVRTFSDSQ